MDPFDPAYRFEDLDELVRNAQARGLEIEMALWGTPGWANGDQVPQMAPTDMNDFRDFAQAIAVRYSGRFPGYPFVRFFGIWNESNLAGRSCGQFDAAGRIVSSAVYARLAIAGYAGVKRPQRGRLVAVGRDLVERPRPPSPRPHRHRRAGTFMQLMAKAAPRMRFDAWAQHLYPFPVNQAPTQPQPLAERDAQPRRSAGGRARPSFKRRNIPIWITEYGNETKPGEPRGVTEAQQARHSPQAIAIAQKNPREDVHLVRLPRLALEHVAASVSMGPRSPRRGLVVHGRLTRRAERQDHRPRGCTVGLYATGPTCATSAPTMRFGAAVGSTTRVRVAGNLVGVTQAQVLLGLDCAIQVQLPVTVRRGTTYVATIDLNVTTGNTAQRKITLVGTWISRSRGSAPSRSATLNTSRRRPPLGNGRRRTADTQRPPYTGSPAGCESGRIGRLLKTVGSQGPVGSNPFPAVPSRERPRPPIQSHA